MVGRGTARRTAHACVEPGCPTLVRPGAKHTRGEDTAYITLAIATAPRYGALRAELERNGTPLGDADLRIGAIASALGLTMVTGNVRPFQRIPGLTIENWLAQ